VAAMTDDDGRFVLPAGSPGLYEVTVRKSGYPAQTVQVDTSAHRPITVVLRSG